MRQAVILLKKKLWALTLSVLPVLALAGVAHTLSAAKDVDAVRLESVSLPVLMYHSLLKDTNHAGSYTLPPTLFETDMRYLQARGYAAVLPSELIGYTQGLCDLPKKPVMITFDDGQYNNYVYATPVLEETGMRAAVSIIGAPTEQFSELKDKSLLYAYLTWAEIREMQESGLYEIGNHSYRLHSLSRGRKGVLRCGGENINEYRDLLTADIGDLQEALYLHCGFAPVLFAYPFGFWDRESELVLKELGFLMTLTCNETINTITRDPESLYLLGRFNRPAGISTEAFMAAAGIS